MPKTTPFQQELDTATERLRALVEEAEALDQRRSAINASILQLNGRVAVLQELRGEREPLEPQPTD